MQAVSGSPPLVGQRERPALGPLPICRKETAPSPPPPAIIINSSVRPSDHPPNQLPSPTNPWLPAAPPSSKSICCTYASGPPFASLSKVSLPTQGRRKATRFLLLTSTIQISWRCCGTLRSCSPWLSVPARANSVP